MELKQIEAIAARCKNCELHVGRKLPVFSRGNPNASVVICGMSPGPDENEEGSPFVGKAGKCLDKLIEQSPFNAEGLYITNIVKCFVKPGTKLDQFWIDSCYPYFLLQMQIIQPKIIISLGADATNGLLGFPLNTKIGVLRKSKENFWFDVPADPKDEDCTGEMLGIPVIPTYHPAYADYNGGEKSAPFKKILEDFNKAYERLV